MICHYKTQYLSNRKVDSKIYIIKATSASLMLVFISRSSHICWSLLFFVVVSCSISYRLCYYKRYNSLSKNCKKLIYQIWPFLYLFRMTEIKILFLCQKICCGFVFLFRIHLPNNYLACVCISTQFILYFRTIRFMTLVNI